jgi:hypothetical protein
MEAVVTGKMIDIETAIDVLWNKVHELARVKKKTNIATFVRSLNMMGLH